MATPATIAIKGTLNPDGTIHVDLPEGWQPGEVTVEIAIEPTYTEEELDELLKPNPRPASEIETGGWEDLEIQDGAEWVENQRRKRREQNKW
ncbi:MAG: hypothetical protein AAFR81_07005 [Chloroflexota bacterium]